MITEVRLQVSESSTGSQYYMSFTDSEHKFHKIGIKNWLPIGFNLAMITTALSSTSNLESLKILYIYV